MSGIICNNMYKGYYEKGEILKCLLRMSIDTQYGYQHTIKKGPLKRGGKKYNCSNKSCLFLEFGIMFKIYNTILTSIERFDSKIVWLVAYYI